MGEWTDEDEKKHPRGTGAQGGQFVAKDESTAQDWSKQRAEERKADEQRNKVATKFAPWKPQEKTTKKTSRSSGGRSSGGHSRGGGKGSSASSSKGALDKLGTLEEGKKNDPDQVRELQGLLKDLGLFKGNPDGKFGNSTQTAVKEAQRKLGVKNPNGRATSALIRKMQAARALSPCLSTRESVNPLMGEGGDVSAAALVSYARRPALTLVRLAREAFDESKHLRGAKGRFRDMLSVLDDWARGKGGDNPLDDFDRPALISGAKKLGLKPNGRRWPDDGQLRKDIYAAKRAEFNGEAPRSMSDMAIDRPESMSDIAAELDGLSDREKRTKMKGWGFSDRETNELLGQPEKPTAAAKVKAAKAAQPRVGGSKRPPTSDTAAKIRKATSPDEVVQILDEAGHSRAEMYQVADELGLTLPQGLRKPEVIADSIASRLDAKGFDADVSATRKKKIADTAEKIRNLDDPEKILAALDEAGLSRRDTRLVGEELGVKVPQGITKPELIAENIAGKVAIKNAPKPAKATKAATPRKASAPDLTGAGGLSKDPAVRAVQVENRVKAAQERLSRRPGDWVPLADIRDEMPEVSREEVDAALKSLGMQPGVQLIPWDNRKALTSRDHDAAVRFGGGDNHVLRIEDHRPRPLPSTAAPTKATKAATPRVPKEPRAPGEIAAKLSSAKTREEAAAALDGLTAAELKRVAKDTGTDLTLATTKDAMKSRIVEHSVGFKLNSAAIRDGSWNAGRPSSPAEVDSPRKPFDGDALLTLLDDPEVWANPPSREEVHAMLDGATPRELRALGKKLHIPKPEQLEMEQLKERIVFATVGRRLDSIALRGFKGRHPGSPQPAEVDSRLDDAVTRLAAKSDSGWVSIADLRESPEFKDLPRAEQDAAIKRLAGDGSRGDVINVENAKSLSQRDRDAAISIGGREQHAIRLKGKAGGLHETVATAGGGTISKIDAAKRMFGDWEASDRPATVLAEMSTPDLKALASHYGVSSSGSKQDLVDRISAHVRAMKAGGAGPKAGKPAKVGELQQQAARTRQAKIDKVRPVAEALSELDELSALDTSPQVVEERIRTRARNSGLSPEVTDQLVAAGISGDRDRTTQVMDSVAAQHGLTRISAPAGAVEKLDRTKHKPIAGSSIDNGSYVHIVRPGYQSSVDGDNVRLHHAVVEPASPAEIRQHLAPQLKQRMADAPRVQAAKKVEAARKAREEHAARLKSALDRGMSPAEAEAFARSGMNFTEWRATHK